MDELTPPAPRAFVHPAQRHPSLGGPRETLLYAVPDAEAQARVVRALERSGDDALVTMALRSSNSEHLVAVHCPRTWEAMRAVRAIVETADPDAVQVRGARGTIDLTAPEGPWAISA
jgi:hypothetical protein